MAESKMNCPKCETETLQPNRIDDIDVDRCSRCRGIWFDERELSTLLSVDKSTIRQLRDGKEQPQLNSRIGVCPRDGSNLMRVFSSANRDVVVDRCPECRGVWLDGGEFDKLYRPQNRSRAP